MLRKTTEWFQDVYGDKAYCVVSEQIYTIDVSSYTVRKKVRGWEDRRFKVEQEIDIQITSPVPFFITIQTISRDSRDRFGGTEMLNQRLYINVDDEGISVGSAQRTNQQSCLTKLH